MSEPVTEETAVVYPELNDFEIDVFNELCPAMDTVVHPGNFRSEEVYEIESFPTCTFVRVDTMPDWKRESTSNFEDYTIETYEANVYALSKAECSTIMNTLAERLRQMNFRRLSMRPVKNYNDPRVKRLVARFEIKIDNQGQMYRT